MTPALIKIVPIAHLSLGFLMAALTIAFLIRIVLTWYPEINVKEGLWIFVVFPTEPFLVFTRRFVKPIGGVDVTPVIWLGLTSLLRELVVGQQGILSQILLKSQNLA